MDEITQPSKKRSKSKIILTIFSVLLIGGVIFYTLYSDFSKNDEISFEALKHALNENSISILFAFCGFIAFILLKASVLSFMMLINGQPPHFLLCIQNIITGKYYDYVTPLGTGGQPFQIYQFHKQNIDDSIAVSLPVAEYSMYRFGFVLVAIVAIFFNFFDVFKTSNSINLFITICSLFGLFCNLIAPSILLLFFISPKIISFLLSKIIKLGVKMKFIKDYEYSYHHYLEILNQNKERIKRVFSKKIYVIPILLLEVLATLSMCSIAFFSLKAFGYQTGNGFFYDFGQISVFCMLLNCAVTFVPTPGNAGAADFTFYWLFHSLLVTGVGSSAMLVWRFFSFYNFILLYFIMKITGKIYTHFKPHKRKDA